MVQAQDVLENAVPAQGQLAQPAQIVSALQWCGTHTFYQVLQSCRGGKSRFNHLFIIREHVSSQHNREAAAVAVKVQPELIHTCTFPTTQNDLHEPH